MTFRHLRDVLDHRAALWPDAIAVGGQEGIGWKTLSSTQFQVQVDTLAVQLRERGVHKGDRVILWVPNGWRAPIYLFALWTLDAVVVPFDKEMNPEAGAAIWQSVQPRLVISGYDEAPAWAVGPVTTWWDPAAPPAAADLVPEPPSASHDEVDGLAAIFFTSGTTGNPKGCMISHENLCSQIDALAERMPLDPECRLASILPLSHLFELTCGLVYPLAQGSAIHYIPSRRAPDIVRVLSEQKISHMVVVPQLLTLMGQSLEQQLKAKLPASAVNALYSAADRLSLPARHRLFFMVHKKLGGHLRMVASGGAALAPEVQVLWERMGVRVVQGYGTSECAPVVACGDYRGSPVGSVGKALNNVTVRFSPEGELQVSGPNVMRGYWRDPAKTAEVLHDGWYSTGDLATMDHECNIRLTGRAKDLIALPSGLNVWPQDVEDVLRAEPGVKDAAIVLVHQPGGGATLHAYLLPSGAKTDVGPIVASANGRLALHQRLATASWWPDADFPRTSTLKLKRGLLPQPEKDQATEISALDSADDPVGRVIAGAARVPAVRNDQTLAELGLDSLALVELAVALEEKAGKAVEDGDLIPSMTVEQVRAFLAGQPSAAGDDAESELEKGVGLMPMWPYTAGRALRWISFPFDWLYNVAVTKTLISGREHLEGLDGQVIFAGTHHSFTDVPLIRNSLAKSPAKRWARRLIITAAAGGVGWSSPLAMYGILAFGLFPLHRSRGREESLRRLLEAARAGNAILIFPQGTHADPEQERANDEAVRFRPGVFHIAQALDAPVVPFGLAGTEVVMPPDVSKFKGPTIASIPVSLTRKPLAIAFGEPLRVRPGEEPEQFAARLQEASYALSRRSEEALNGSQAT